MEVRRADLFEPVGNAIGPIDDRTAGDQKRHAVTPPAHRDRVGDRRFADAGQGVDPRHDLAQVCVQLIGLRELAARDWQTRRDDVGRVESGVDTHHLEEAADEQARADEQHERQRDFDHHERAAQPAAARVGRRSAPAFLHRPRQIRFRRLQRGREAEDHAGRQRQYQRECEHTRIHRDVRVAWQRERRDDQFEAVHHRVADQDPEGAADRGEQDVLGEKLPQQPPASSAERGAHGDVALARRAARERQVRQVHATDEQQHPHGAEQHIQRASELRADQDVDVPLDGDAPTFVRIGIVGRDPRADGIHLGARLFDRHARLQTSKRGHPMEVARAFTRLEGKRPPHLREAAIERGALRHHADDGVRLAIERERSPDDAGVGAERRRPQLVAQHDDVLFARFVLVGRERTAERGLDLKDIEVSGGDPRAAQEHRLLDAG